LLSANRRGVQSKKYSRQRLQYLQRPSRYNKSRQLQTMWLLTHHHCNHMHNSGILNKKECHSRCQLPPLHLLHKPASLSRQGVATVGLLIELIRMTTETTRGQYFLRTLSFGQQTRGVLDLLVNIDI
jgi:hypothetical protein